MQFGFQSGVERPLKMHFNHITVKFSGEWNVSVVAMASSVGSPPKTCDVSSRLILFVLICICALPVKDGSYTCAVSTVPVDMQAGGQ